MKRVQNVSRPGNGWLAATSKPAEMVNQLGRRSVIA